MYLISSKRGSKDPLCQRETRKGFEAERPMDKKQPGLMAEREPTTVAVVCLTWIDSRFSSLWRGGYFLQRWSACN